MVKPTQKVANQAPQDSANKLARYIHNAFMGKGTLLTSQQIINSGVQYDITRKNTTERLYVNGEVDGQSAYQTLSYSPRKCKWFFTTVFTGFGGKVICRRIGAGNDSSAEIIEALNQSIFMRRLNEILTGS